MQRHLRRHLRTLMIVLFAFGAGIGTNIVVSKLAPGADAAVSADLNGDGIVNALDLSMLLSQWGTKTTGTSSDPRPDLNGDGTVNALDLSILLSQWGTKTGGNTGTTTPTPTATAVASTGFITKSGQNLMLGGKKFQFIGFDAYGMTGCASGTAWTTSQLDTYFSRLPTNGVTRLWAFQNYGTAKIQTILTEAAKYKQHVILTLGDDDSACNDTNGAPGGDSSGKTLAYYQTGWKGDYLTWVNTIVPMFKTNPSIAMWEIANEPGQAGTQPDVTTMTNYLSGAAAAIKADDPNHLVDSGANDNGNFGSQANYITAQSSTNIDVISFHDYSYEYENKAVISGHFTDAQAAAKQLNKPYIAGEAGVTAGNGCSVSYATRESFLMQKANDYLANGIAGIDFWDYEPAQPAGCYYDINATDPLISAVKGNSYAQ